MKRYRLTAQALYDLDTIWTYIAHRSGTVESADRLEDAFHRSFKKIAKMPGMGRHFVGDSSYESFRFLTMEKYIIAYRERDAWVDILCILHGSRNLEKILAERLIHG